MKIQYGTHFEVSEIELIAQTPGGVPATISIRMTEADEQEEIEHVLSLHEAICLLTELVEQVHIASEHERNRA